MLLCWYSFGEEMIMGVHVPGTYVSAYFLPSAWFSIS